jgi:hypothetical protein
MHTHYSFFQLTKGACFVEWMRDDLVEICPDYQRGQSTLAASDKGVIMNHARQTWYGMKQSKLTSSTLYSRTTPSLISFSVSRLLNSDVPVLIHKLVRHYKDGDWHRVCIDGKQRLTSIRRCALPLILAGYATLIV